MPAVTCVSQRPETVAICVCVCVCVCVGVCMCVLECVCLCEFFCCAATLNNVTVALVKKK